MCWVALDRALRLADKRSFPADRERWLKTRDAIYEEILTSGWSQEKQAFVQHYDSDSLDASSLIMPLVFFMAPTDPKMLSTIDAINRSPRNGGLVSSGLVYRYDDAARLRTDCPAKKALLTSAPSGSLRLSLARGREIGGGSNKPAFCSRRC